VKAIVINIWRQFIWDTIVIRYPEWRFDRKWGVETGGIVPVPNGSTELHRYCEKYQATPPAIFQDMVRSLNLDLSRFLFFDMGCGKGRVLLLASEYPFRSIIGVELLPDLAAIAERNLARCSSTTRRCANIHVVHRNAAEFAFPDQDALIFFYNPFKEEIMRKVLDNIRHSVRATSERYILYLDPLLSRPLDNCAFLSAVVNKERYSIYKVVA